MAKHGIKVSGVELDLGAMLNNKDEVVKGLTQGIEFLFKKNKVDYVVGAGADRERRQGRGRGQRRRQPRSSTTKNILIATGSDVMPLPGVTIDEERIVSSTGALDLEDVPKHLLIVGAGYIGLEMGTVWRRLGAKVTVVEFLDRDHARHGRRDRQGVPEDPDQAGRGLQARHQGDRRRQRRRAGQGHGRAGQGRAAGDDRVRHRAGLDRPPALHGGARAWRRSA